MPDILKQYVNLTADPTQPRLGNSVEIHVRAQPDPNPSDPVRQAKWAVQPVDPSKNTALAFLAAAARAQFATAETAETQTFVDPSGGTNKWEFVNTLTLPQVGGDVFKVLCHKVTDPSHKVEYPKHFQTWRKIYYTAHYENADCRAAYLAVKQKLKDAYAPGFVEWEEVGLHQTIAGEVAEDDGNSPSLPNMHNNLPALDHPPFHLRLVFTKWIADLEEQDEDGEVPAGTVSAPQAPSLDITTTDDLAKDPIVSSQAKTHDGTSWGPWADVPCARAEDKKLTLDLSGSGGLRTKYKVKYNTRDYSCGWALGNFCVIAFEVPDSFKSSRTRKMIATLTHELGHSLQQAVKDEAQYDTGTGVAAMTKGKVPVALREKNPYWHTNDFGGQGNHCFINCKLVTSTSTTSGKIYAYGGSQSSAMAEKATKFPGAAKGGLCTMFHSDESHVDDDGKFCGWCIERLRRVSLDAPAMTAKGWTRFP
ncbi:MAG: hypothetical protein ACRELB_18785 [Polyangiaceae bacterium]